MVEKLITELKQTTAAQFFRAASAVITALFSIWLFAGPFVKSYAADALLDVLVKQGIDPANIAAMQHQGIENGRKIEDLNSDVEMVNRSLQQLLQQQAATANSSQETHRLVEQLLQIQLQKTGVNP